MSATPEPDLLLRNALVDPADPRPSSIAIRGGAILTCAPDEQLADAAGAATTVYDLGGRRVVPGLVDSHAHVLRGGLTWEREVDWAELTSLRAGLDRIAARAGEMPAGTWISVVGGWHPGQFAERRRPTRAELDALCPEHPVYVQLLYDEGLLNAAGLRASGLADAAAGPGFEIERDAAGEPTGVVRGLGAFAFCMAAIGDPSPAEQERSLRAFLDHLAGRGITGAIDPGGFGVGLDRYAPLYELWRRDELPLRLRLFLCATRPGEEVEELADLMRVLPRGFGDERLRLAGVGELVVAGCHDMEGLERRPIDRESRRRLLEISRIAAERGWPVHIHAILDETIAAVLDAWEQVAERHDLGRLGFTLAHVEAIGERSLARARRLRLALALQNRLMLRAADSARAWGRELVEQAPPLARLLAGGAAVGAGTDGTRVTPINPWRSLWWFATGRPLDGGPRRAAEHRLDRATALRLYTSGSAALSGDDGRRGRIAPGMQADLAVLDRDWFAIADQELPEIRSDLTLVGGRPAHASGALAPARVGIEPAAFAGA